MYQWSQTTWKSDAAADVDANAVGVGVAVGGDGGDDDDDDVAAHDASCTWNCCASNALDSEM